MWLCDLGIYFYPQNTFSKYKFYHVGKNLAHIQDRPLHLLNVTHIPPPILSVQLYIKLLCLLFFLPLFHSIILSYKLLSTVPYLHTVFYLKSFQFRITSLFCRYVFDGKPPELKSGEVKYRITCVVFYSCQLIICFMLYIAFIFLSRNFSNVILACKKNRKKRTSPKRTWTSWRSRYYNLFRVFMEGKNWQLTKVQKSLLHMIRINSYYWPSLPWWKNLVWNAQPTS